MHYGDSVAPFQGFVSMALLTFGVRRFFAAFRSHGG